MRQYSQDELEAQKLFRNRQRQNLMHSLQPSNLGAPSAQNYLDRLQRESVKGQLEYIKKKERRRRLLMQKGIKQAERFYKYTLKHGYGKDQDREMWKTLSRLQSEKPSASQRPHRIE